MKHFLLTLTIASSMVSTAWAGNDSPPPAALPTAPKWSLTVLEPRVAAGGLPTAEHQSEFVVRALDAKGKPLVGLPVELPSIWNDKEWMDDKKPTDSEESMPRVEWRSGGKIAVTDSKGEARGLFTSGKKPSHLILHGPNQTQADITTIWNDNPTPSKDTPTYFFVGRPQTQRYQLSLQRGDKMLPITGHHLKYVIMDIVLTAQPCTGLDEKGEPKLTGLPYSWDVFRPEENASPEEIARWEKILSWIEVSEMKETSPGAYEGSCTVRNPKEKLLEGLFIEGVNTWGAEVKDQGVWEP